MSVAQQTEIHGELEAAQRHISMRMSMTGTEDFGFQLIEQPKKVKLIPLNFARAAKRVDVRALKRNIWLELVKDTSKVC